MEKSKSPSREVQQTLTTGNYQKTISEPLVRTEIVVEDSAKEPELASSEQPQVEEQVLTVKQDELQELQLSKRIEHDALSLMHQLRIEKELLVRIKAKEKVVEYSCKYQLQQLQENREEIQKNISNLEKIKEELEEKLEQDKFEDTQLEREMDTIGKVVEVLSERCESTKNNYDTLATVIQNLKQEQKELYENYNSQLQKFRAEIMKENTNLQGIHKQFEVDQLRHADEMNKKKVALEELIAEHVKMTREIADVTEQCEDLKIRLQKNTRVLDEELSKNQSLRNSLSIINLEEVKAQKAKLEQNNHDHLTAAKNTLDESVKSLNAAVQSITMLQESLEKETNYTNELESTLSKLEEENMKLSSAKQLLIEANEEVAATSAQITHKFNCQLQEMENDFTKLNQKLNALVKDNKDKAKILQTLRQSNQEKSLKLAAAHQLEENLKKEIDASTFKLEQLHQRKADLESDLQKASVSHREAKAKYELERELKSSQLKELDEKTISARTECENTKREGERKVQLLNDELSMYIIQSEQALQENRSRYQQKLQQLQEELSKSEHNLEQAKKDRDRLPLLIAKKQALCERYEKEFAEFTAPQKLSSETTDAMQASSYKSSAQEPAQIVKPTSILKSPGKSPAKPTVSPKKVTFVQEPDAISLSSSSSFDAALQLGTGNREPFQCHTSEEIFDKLLRTSPPERLHSNRSKKRSRLDSP